LAEITEYLQSDINLFRRVDVVLLGPVAHEPGLHGKDSVAKQHAADKQYPKHDWVRSSQIVNKQLDFILDQ
jgi:hypothetical protein